MKLKKWPKARLTIVLNALKDQILAYLSESNCKFRSLCSHLSLSSKPLHSICYLWSHLDFRKKIQYFMRHLNLSFTLKIWLFFESRAQHLLMCRGVMNRHQRWMKIELLVQPWRLNGDLNSDENDRTLSDTSKAESSCGSLVFASYFPEHPEE